MSAHLAPMAAPALAKDTDKKTQASGGKFAYLDELHLADIEDRIAQGDYVSAEDLAAALRKHGMRPIPPSVLKYLCRHLEGQVAKPKGRKALPEVVKLRRLMFVRYYYRRTLTWLQARKARYGDLDGWRGIRGASWWQGPPHQRAARMVAQRLGFGAESWKTIQKQASSRK